MENISPVVSLRCGVESVECGIWSMEYKINSMEYKEIYILFFLNLFIYSKLKLYKFNYEL